MDQGIGQASLEWNGRKNEEVLADKSVKQEHKEKIKKITEYKKFFYEFFEKEPTNIYDQTTFLDDPAVTYLVIASPANEIKPLEHSFPIVGTFPYIGFFNHKDAKKFAKDLSKEKYETYIRPGYAYSTLNQWIFDDNILSSFFSYEDLELAELVFHELFHTVFFVKNEVSLNENLAQYFSRELVFEYFKYGRLEKANYISKKEKEKKLIQKVVSLTGDLKSIYEQNRRLPSDSKKAREEFVENVFSPEIRKTCNELAVAKCWPLEAKWNNARFAAFLTYESGQNKIEKLRDKSFPDLKAFYGHLDTKLDEYESGGEGSFEEFIFKE